MVDIFTSRRLFFLISIIFFVRFISRGLFVVEGIGTADRGFMANGGSVDGIDIVSVEVSGSEVVLVKGSEMSSVVEVLVPG